MTPKKTMTIPTTEYRMEVSYFGTDGCEYYFTELVYSPNDEEWRVYDPFHKIRLFESQLNEVITPEELARANAEADEKDAEFTKFCEGLYESFKKNNGGTK